MTAALKDRVSVNRGDFSPFDPGVDRPLRKVSRREARRAFALLMDARASRLDELGRLLPSNGMKLSDDDGNFEINT